MSLIYNTLCFKCISTSNFAHFLSNTHVNDNVSISNNNTDKMYKLEPMINQLNSNFVKLHNVSHHVSVDESIILFKSWNTLKEVSNCGHWVMWMVICIISKFIKEIIKCLLMSQCASVLAQVHSEYIDLQNLYMASAFRVFLARYW